VSGARPPRITSWLLRRFGPAGDAGRSIAGDLLEEFRDAGGSSAARRHYRRHAASIVLRYGAARLRRPGVNPSNDTARKGRSVFHAQSGRDLRHSRVLGAAFALSLSRHSLGIGAATAIFSIVDGVS
jgi:hypothetical protein